MTLVGNIGSAIDTAMADVHEQLDAELASRAICLHYTAVRVPGNHEADRRTVSMRNYARILSAARVEFSHVEAAVARMLGDSLDETFLVWTGKFCRDNPSVTNSAIAERLTMFSVFVALRSLVSTDEKIDRLFDLEEKSRTEFETARASYDAAVKTAKDKLDKFSIAYEEASRRRCRASGLSTEADALTAAVPNDLREATRAAEQRYQQRKANPTRNRKGKTKEPATEPTSAESPQVQTTAAEGETK